jgi:hypothetical protein
MGTIVDKPFASPAPANPGERPLSVAEIRGFITGKRIAGCPVCNHYNWQIREGTTAIRCVCASAADSDGAQPATANVAIIMLVCQNCGAVEFHDRGVIARWLDCHPAAGKA